MAELDSSANDGIMSRVLGLRGLRRSTTMNSSATDRSGDAADIPSDAEHFENPAHSKSKGGIRTYARSTSRQSAVRTAPSLSLIHI